jgi:hypothetical protein
MVMPGQHSVASQHDLTHRLEIQLWPTEAHEAGSLQPGEHCDGASNIRLTNTLTVFKPESAPFAMQPV